VVAAESLQAAASGIGRVARLTLKVLAEQAQAGRIALRAIALSDESPVRDWGVPVTACRGSRARFVVECQRAALDATHFIYDFAGMARAHPRLPRRRALVWVHGIEVWEHATSAHLRALKRADAVLVNSAYTRRRAEGHHGGLSRSALCWLGSESDAPAASRARSALRRISEVPSSQPQNVLILARVDADGGYKGHRELIAAWPRVLAAVPDARLLIAGGGPGQAWLARTVAASPVHPQIELLGFVPEAALDALWARTAVLAMPSRGEGFGLAYLEAMRQGVPVIGSIHDAAQEVNVHGETGYNVDLAVPGALADSLIRVLDDRALARRLGAAGRARWEQHFRYSRFRERALPLIGGFLAVELPL
jgi:phosphatidylinositol alpha-1,6-mannosyltransferase